MAFRGSWSAPCNLVLSGTQGGSFGSNAGAAVGKTSRAPCRRKLEMMILAQTTTALARGAGEGRVEHLRRA